MTKVITTVPLSLFLAFFLLASTLLGPFVAYAAPSLQPTPLSNTSWKLISLSTGETPSPPVRGTMITLDFTDSGVSGSVGCNTYRGSYSILENRLNIGQVVSTRRGCAEAIMQQETTYLDTLQGDTTIDLSGNTLIITTADASFKLTLARTTSVNNSPAGSVGRDWRLETLEAGGVAASLVAGSEITLRFDVDSSFSGEAGCNLYRGNYARDGNKVAVSEIVSTRRACADPAVTKQEQQYLDALHRVTQYELTPDRLTLTIGDNAGKLVYGTVAAPFPSPPSPSPPSPSPLTPLPRGEGETPSAAPTSIGTVEPAGTLQRAFPAMRESMVCPFHLATERAEVEGQTYQCGILRLPQDRSKPDGLQIGIAFVLLKSWSNNPLPDPLLSLEGGPGGSALEIAALRAREFDDIRQTRDVILFDPRGVGFSTPRINCEQDFGQPVQVLAECARVLRASGQNLDLYDTRTNAADALDLIHALGYTRVNLYGVSYGTRLALEIMRRAPELVRSVVLDSTYPTDVLSYEQRAEAENTAALRVFSDCAADRDCDAHFPQLQDRFFALLKKLDAQPVTLDGAPFDGRALAEFVFAATLDPTDAREIPLVIAELEQGETDALAYALSDRFALDPSGFQILRYDDIFSNALDFLTSSETAEQQQQIIGELARLSRMAKSKEELYTFIANHFTGADADTLNGLVNAMTSYEVTRLFANASHSASTDVFRGGTNQAVFMLTECREEIPYNDLQKAMANANAQSLANYLELGRTKLTRPECDQLGLTPVDSSFKDPVTSDLPVLLLAGTYDSSTPIAWAEQAARNLKNSILVPYVSGHGVLKLDPCAIGIMDEFVDTPSRLPDLECVKPVRFLTELPAPAPNPLVGEWVLESFGAPEAELEPLAGTRITLELDAGGKASGSAGCNSYGGSYNAQRGAVLFENVFATERGCAPEILKQEQRYLNALSVTGAYSVEGDRLTIWFNIGRGVLHFKRASNASGTPTATPNPFNLAGTAWQLQTITVGNIARSPVANTTLALWFGTDGKLRGSAGCNSFEGGYKTTGEIIEISKLVATLKACVEPGVMEQEQQYLAVLAKAQLFQLRGEELAITYDNGSGTLVYGTVAAASTPAPPDASSRRNPESTAVVVLRDDASPAPLPQGEGGTPTALTTVPEPASPTATAATPTSAATIQPAGTVPPFATAMPSATSSTPVAAEPPPTVQPTTTVSPTRTIQPSGTATPTATVQRPFPTATATTSLALLVNTEWRLELFESGGVKQNIVLDSTITIHFGEGGLGSLPAAFTGFAGCNTFFGTYGIANGRLLIKNEAITAQGCPTAALAKQEGDFLKALANVSAFTRNGNRLTLTFAGGRLNWVKV